MRLWNDGWQVALVSGAFWFFQQVRFPSRHTKCFVSCTSAEVITKRTPLAPRSADGGWGDTRAPAHGGALLAQAAATLRVRNHDAWLPSPSLCNRRLKGAPRLSDCSARFAAARPPPHQPPRGEAEARGGRAHPGSGAGGQRGARAAPRGLSADALGRLLRGGAQLRAPGRARVPAVHGEPVAGGLAGTEAHVRKVRRAAGHQQRRSSLRRWWWWVAAPADGGARCCQPGGLGVRHSVRRSRQGWLGVGESPIASPRWARRARRRRLGTNFSLRCQTGKVGSGKPEKW